MHQMRERRVCCIHVLYSIFQRHMGNIILKNQWQHVLSEMYRVLKPEGTIELVEADLWHHNPGPVQTAFDEFHQTQCDELGLDFKFTTTLEEELRSTGFQQIESRTLDIPIGEWPQEAGMLTNNSQSRDSL